MNLDDALTVLAALGRADVRDAIRGVRRFRSIEEADAHRQRRESGAAGGSGGEPRER
jgi:hypothetical protein